MSEAANMPQDKLIDGRYRIVSKIADGGMATVYKAVDVRLGREVALKIMHMQLAQGPHRDQFVERFRREANSAAAIANPHVVQVYDTGENDGLDYLVMEYVHGVNLRHEMQTKHTFSVRETLRVVSETLNGLAAAHHIGVVHRDIKPENILINDRGRVQITDFGLAKAASQATLSSTGMLLGTAAYLAPEMIENNQATAQGDCYAVGIMAWEMLTGQVPFVTDNPVTMVFKHVNENVPSVATICTGIDPQVARFISFLTNRQVEDRPADASQALDRLRELMATLSPEALQYRYDPDAQPSHGTSILPIVSNKAQSTAAPLQSSPTPLPATDQQSAAVEQNPATHPADEALANTQPADDDTHIHPNDDPTQALAATSETPITTLAKAAAANPEVNHSGMPHAAFANQSNNQPTIRQNNPHHNRNIIIIIVSVLIVLLGSIGGGLAWYYYYGPGSYVTLPQPEGLTCQENTPCTITDVSWRSYEAALKEAGIPYETTEAYSDTIAKGNVISTDPVHVGAHLSKRTDPAQAVTVVVSLGVQQATVPEEIMSSSDPVGDLQKAGFTNIVHNESDDQWSATIPAGDAISVSLTPGKTYDHNEEVTVVLSKGPMPVQMPNVVGKSSTDAKAQLEENKLTVTTSEENSDTVPAGQVISASEAAGAELHWGDSVHLVVSSGPQMVTIPDVTGMNVDEAQKKLEALGLQVKISAPLGDLLHTVRIQSPDGGTEVRVRDENGNPTVVTLTVI